MNVKNESIKETITKMVMTTSSLSKGSKSGGVKIATLKRDIPINTIAPFSL